MINNVLVNQTLCTNLWNCTTSVEHITKDKDRPNSLFTLRSPAPDNTQFVYMELHRNNSTHVGKRRHVETDLSPLTSPRSRSPDDLGSGLMGLHNINKISAQVLLRPKNPFHLLTRSFGLWNYITSTTHILEDEDTGT